MQTVLPNKIKYITNKELLAEIKTCKASYCHFTAPQYACYDAIVASVDDINQELVDRLSAAKIAKQPQSDATIVFRVMTDSHLPFAEDKNKRRKTEDGGVAKTNFNPFRHFIFQDGHLIEVGRSHWVGDFETGRFSVAHGQINNRLASMFMLLVEKYSRGGNWRGYCVDETTEALTQRGWLSIDQINEQDIILSYSDGSLRWSKIKSIFRDHYDGKMFKLTGRGIDALVTPRHKFVTDSGLKQVEHLVAKDRLILAGEQHEIGVEEIDFHGGKRSVQPNEPTVDYQGRVWCPETEFGCFMARRNGTIYLTGNTYADEMRSHALTHLSQVGLQFDESRSDNPFAFYTQIVKHCFTRVLNLERRNQEIRDDLLIMAGVMPSYTRQVDNEINQRQGDQKPATPARRGRKPKVQVE